MIILIATARLFKKIVTLRFLYGLLSLVGIKTPYAPFSWKRLFIFFYCVITYIMCPFFRNLFYDTYIYVSDILTHFVFTPFYRSYGFLISSVRRLISTVLSIGLVDIDNFCKYIFCKLQWIYSVYQYHIDMLAKHIYNIFTQLYSYATQLYISLKINSIYEFFFNYTLSFLTILNSIKNYILLNHYKCQNKYYTVFIIVLILFGFLYIEIRKTFSFLHAKVIKSSSNNRGKFFFFNFTLNKFLVKLKDKEHQK